MKLTKSDKTVIYSLVGSALGFAVSKVTGADRAVSVTVGGAIGTIAGNHDQQPATAAKSSAARRPSTKK
jgi:hypothetical protein